MATQARIQELEKRRAEVAKQISEAKKSLVKAERKADTHMKAAIGGAMIAFFDQENCPETIRHFILTKADQGIEKQGLGREKFEALKARFVKKVEK
jgi:hypothetical protein